MLSASKELETAHIQSSVQQTFASRVGPTCVLCAQTYLRPAAKEVLSQPLGKVFRARTVQAKRQVVCCGPDSAPLPRSFLVETSELGCLRGGGSVPSRYLLWRGWSLHWAFLPRGPLAPQGTPPQYARVTHA